MEITKKDKKRRSAKSSIKIDRLLQFNERNEIEQRKQNHLTQYKKKRERES